VLAACGGDDNDSDNSNNSNDTGDSSNEVNLISIGDISSDPIETIQEAQPFADLMAASLVDQGITGGEVRVAADIDEMIAMIADGEVDVYFDSPYPATVISQASGGEMVLRRWRNGYAEYFSMIIVLKDSGISSIEDLNGRVIAFEEPFSTSSFVLPVASLIEDGQSVTELDSIDATVPEDAIGYVFSGDVENSVLWVQEGRVDAGAVDNITYESFDAEVLDQFDVIAQTEAMPRHIAIIGPNVDEDLKAAIIEFLIHAHETDEGVEILAGFGDTNRFDEFPNGTDATIARVLEIAGIIEQLGE
jgi:phosphonate transport system substrate-binding protein